MTIDSKAHEAALAAWENASGISSGMTAAITAYLDALPPPKVEGEPVAWRVTSSNNSPQYFNEEGTAEQWGNSAGIFDSVIEPLYVTPSPVLADEGVAGWQPIETAPTLEDVLVAVPIGKTRWLRIVAKKVPAAGGDWLADGHCLTTKPTHWHPLPTPPAVTP